MLMTELEYWHRLRQLIAESGKRVEDVAYETRLSARGIYRMLEGKTKSPSMKSIGALAKALNTSVAYIMGVDQYDDPHDQHYTPQQQAMLEAVPPKATAAFADFTRGLFSMPEDEWRAFISYNVTHFARIKGLQITERAESKDAMVLGNDPPASEEEEEQDLQEG